MPPSVAHVKGYDEGVCVSARNIIPLASKKTLTLTCLDFTRQCRRGMYHALFPLGKFPSSY